MKYLLNVVFYIIDLQTPITDNKRRAERIVDVLWVYD